MRCQRRQKETMFWVIEENESNCTNNDEYTTPPYLTYSCKCLLFQSCSDADSHINHLSYRLAMISLKSIHIALVRQLFSSNVKYKSRAAGYCKIYPNSYTEWCDANVVFCWNNYLSCEKNTQLWMFGVFQLQVSLNTQSIWFVPVVFCYTSLYSETNTPNNIINASHLPYTIFKYCL